MLIDNLNLPDPIFHAMIANVYTAGNADYTASSIVYGAKEYWGKKKFKELNTETAGLWAPFTGTLMHLGFEKLLQDFNTMIEECNPILKDYIIPEGYYILEDRRTISFNTHAKHFQLSIDKLIGGAIDCRFYFSESGKAKLYDYKTMSSTQIITKDKIKEFTEKANLYRWLMECTGNPISEIEYIPLFKDWTFTKASRSGKIQEYPCIKLKINLWDRKKIEEYIYTRVIEIEKYRETDYALIPYCSMEQRWEDLPIWKVCKIRSDGSLGSQLPGCGFTNEDDAKHKLKEREILAKKDEEFGIKKTGGIPVKCMRYCNLGSSGKCDFLNGMKGK